MNKDKRFFRRVGAVVFWLAVWQCAAMAIGQEVFLVSPCLLYTSPSPRDCR